MRYGNQQPTFETTTEYAISKGDVAVSMFKAYGVAFYPCQEYELRLMLARDVHGRYASKTICISKPRQNGKSYAARMYALWMAAIEGKAVLYSSHHGKTTRGAFEYMDNFINAHDDFLGELKKTYRARGDEGIYFKNFGLIEFQTRTNGAARGRTFDIIVVDEAQELTSTELDALKPTTLASESSDPQMIYLGTPPNEKCFGDVFKAYHDKAHAEPDTCGIWWLEWAVTELPDLTDVDGVLELAYKTNPAMGYRIREDVMRDFIKTAVYVDSFAREMLGWWSNSVAASVISDLLWSQCAIEKPERDGLTVYAVKFSADGRMASLCACIKQPDGRLYVVCIANKTTRRGVRWLANWLIERWQDAAQIVIDGKAYSETLNRKLIDANVSKKAIILPTANELAAACSMLENSVKEQTLCHSNQPALNDSATHTTKRTISKGGGWAFDAIGETDPTLIEACALALWQVCVTKRNPKRKLRIG